MRSVTAVRHVGLLLALPAVLALSGCRDGTGVGPEGAFLGMLADQPPVTPGTPEFEELQICKHWTDGTQGVSTDFAVTVKDLLTDQTSQGTRTLADGECRVVAVFDGTTNIFGPADLTVTENVPPGAQLDLIRVTTITRHGVPAVPPQDITGTNTWSFNGADNAYGFLVEFFNSTPGGGEGCTPGYWKQPHHFDSWVGYTPGQAFSSVFNLPSALQNPNQNVDPASLSLVDALGLGGGGVNALMRHAVAALLNAANPGVSYDLTQAEVIAMFNAAIAGGDVIGTKNELAALNEQGCPLN